jgi:hypothetical protein
VEATADINGFFGPNLPNAGNDEVIFETAHLVDLYNCGWCV